jgi:putative flippase GtrA
MSMTDEMTSAVDLPAHVELPTTIEVPFRARVRHASRQRHNWKQFVRFGLVGASGYVVNLVVFAICVHAIGIDYRVSAPIAYFISVVNNFFLNRHWTFDAKHDPAHHQALRFFAVSLVTFGVTYVVLIALVSATGMEKVIAEAIAVAAATPLSFIGQKFWSFKA